MAVPRQCSDGSSRALLYQGELLSMITGKSLQSSTPGERRHYFASEQSVTIFQLNVTRQALAEIHDVIAKKYKVDNNAFLIYGNWEENYGDFCVKDNLRSLEIHLLAKLQWIKGLKWYLDIPAPVDGNYDKDQYSCKDKSDSNTRDAAGKNVTAEGQVINDGAGFKTEKQASPHPLWPLSMPFCTPDISPFAREPEAGKYIIKRLFNGSGKSMKLLPASEVTSTDRLEEASTVLPQVLEESPVTPKREAHPATTPSDKRSVYGLGIRPRCPSSPSSTSGSVPFWPHLPGPILITAGTIQQQPYTPTKGPVFDLPRLHLPPAPNRKSARSSTDCESGSIQALTTLDVVRSPQQTANQTADNELAHLYRRPLIVAVQKQTEHSSLCVSSVKNTKHVSVHQNNKPSHESTVSLLDIDERVTSGEATPAPLFIAHIPESRQTTNIGVLIDITTPKQTAHTGILIDFSEPSTGKLIDLDAELNTAPGQQEVTELAYATPAKPCRDADIISAISNPNDLTPISKFACRLISTGTTTTTSDNRYETVRQGSRAPKVLDKTHSSFEPYVIRHPIPNRKILRPPVVTLSGSGKNYMPRQPAMNNIPNEDLKYHIFPNETERQVVIRMSRDGSANVPSMLKYGVQYLPNPSTAVAEVGRERGEFQCQSVIISGLLSDAELRHVLPRVRGGNIIEATLVDTVSLGAGRTAYVMFVKWEEAHAYVKYAKENPSHVTVLGQQAVVNLAGTPTYPRHGLQLPTGDQTRCLEFRWAPKQICHQLLEHIEHCYSHVEAALEDMWYDNTGSIILHFRKVDFAIRFEIFLRNRDQYMDRTHYLEYIDDPCAASLERLASSACYARGKYPSLLEDWIARKHGVQHVQSQRVPSDSSSRGHKTQVACSMTQPTLPLTHVLDRTTTQTTAPQVLDQPQPIEAKPSTLALINTPSPEIVASGDTVSNASSSIFADCEDTQPMRDGNIVKPGGGEFQASQIYTFEAFGKKYDYKDYREDPVRWHQAWPSVRNQKMRKPLPAVADK